MDQLEHRGRETWRKADASAREAGKWTELVIHLSTVCWQVYIVPGQASCSWIMRKRKIIADKYTVGKTGLPPPLTSRNSRSLFAGHLISDRASLCPGTNRHLEFKADAEMAGIRIYLVRHGETEANRKGIIQGQLDTSLNETGIRQAQNVARALQTIPFKKAYSSDLSRAADVGTQFTR